MKKNDLFAHMGLTENETRVYKTLVRLGPSSIGTLMQSVKLHRPSTYRALNSLEGGDLVRVMPKGKRHVYVATSPSTLRARLKEELEQLEREITPLEYLYEKRPQKPLVTFVEGKKAVACAYLSIPRTLKKGDVYYRYSARDVVNRKEQIDKRTIEQYRKERDTKQLERYVITNEANFRSKRPVLEQSIKCVPPTFDLFDYDVSQVIYGNNILLVDHNTDTAVNIENKALAHFQKRIFQLMFQLLPK